jgi:aspartyl aminopeptidase
MPKTKSKLSERLAMKKESAWCRLDSKNTKATFGYCEEYVRFLSTCKTEREVVRYLVRRAEKAGFKPISSAKSIKPGDRFYAVNKEKNVALVVAGKSGPADGFHIVCAHIDSPRIDLKQRPLYEDTDSSVALLKTHYYGGVKKYQWANVPLALHGRVLKENGEVVDIVIGERDGDPVFIIPDLLPHLARRLQGERKLFDGIRGEEMNIVVGGMPLPGKSDEKEKIKMLVLKHLNDEYGLVEEDLISAEIEMVPAHNPKDVGFDRSMIGGYGHDDRVCAYTALTAMEGVKVPRRTAVAMFYDKEEIGSEGPTGAQSAFLELFLAEYTKAADPKSDYTSFKLALGRSRAISADVDAGMDPSFKDVHEPLNAARMSHGVVVTKFTGSGGKGGSNDANAEFVGYIRRMFNKAGVAWQSAELGKVDEGGGGTVAKYLAHHNMDVIDIGPPLLSMHSPYELASKIDIYHAHLAYSAFLGATE